ncbi:MAG: hypothetical protein HC800_21210 [Phormidesmis sp. RL_2_1]|nr:hypothetical protein [Phormidesmis sp. RL_2_1]
MALNLTPNLAFNVTVALQQLRSHHLKALFTETLGWQSLEASTASQLPTLPKHFSLPRSCYMPLAYKDNVSVWQVNFVADMPFTAELRQQVYQAIASTQPNTVPLVIFVDATQSRSLWCQSLTQSAVYLSGQPSALWSFRLRRLAQASHDKQPHRALFPSLQIDQAAAHYEMFEKRLADIYNGISGISNTADRQAYAALTLQRLIFIQSVQQKGWLEGDTWYLQTRFEQARSSRSQQNRSQPSQLQQNPLPSLQKPKAQTLFFTSCLQPLYQSLAMPRLERPRALQQTVGAVPFLGHLFDTHRLEQQYQAIAIDDQSFEACLGWLSEQSSTDRLNPWMNSELSYFLERYLGAAETSPRPATWAHRHWLRRCAIAP